VADPKSAPRAGVPRAVVDAVKAWAAANDDAGRVLAEKRVSLDPLLLPVLLTEIAEVSCEQLLLALDMPPRTPPAADEKTVPFVGLELSQEQGQRLLLWLQEQRTTADALLQSPEAWSKRVAEGMEQVLVALRGKPLSALTAAIGQGIAGDPLAAASKGFVGAVDPRTSEKAGLRGVLAARNFKKDPKKDPKP